MLIVMAPVLIFHHSGPINGLYWTGLFIVKWQSVACVLRPKPEAIVQRYYIGTEIKTNRMESFVQIVNKR